MDRNELIAIAERSMPFFRETLIALESLDNKRLLHGEFADGLGDFCAVGVVCFMREPNRYWHYESEEPTVLAEFLGVDKSMISALMAVNDDDHDVYGGDTETASHRYERVLVWVCDVIEDPSRIVSYYEGGDGYEILSIIS